MSDASGRTTRTFVCRDPLWESLAHVATELECTIDYLVNDAIKHYLRQRLVRRPLPPEPDTPAAPPPIVAPLPPINPPPLPRAKAPPPLPPRPSMVQTVRLTAPVAPPRLVVSHGTECRTVSGPVFIIGRSKTSGLALRDPNVSRHHARVELEGSVYYLVDEGSTNGTWVNGERIKRRAIADGDVATICDLAVRFAFVH